MNTTIAKWEKFRKTVGFNQIGVIEYRVFHVITTVLVTCRGHLTPKWELLNTPVITTIAKEEFLNTTCKTKINQ